MSKTLTLGAIKKENAKYRETKRIQLDSKNHLDVNIKFDPDTKALAKAEFIQLFFDKLIEITKESNVEGEFDQQLHEEKCEEYLSTDISIGIQTALMIKHFSTLSVEAKTYDDYVDLMSQLGKYEYTEDILNGFDKEETNKLLEEFAVEIDATNNKILEEVEKEKLKQQSQVSE
ncbi:hypothetical protein [Paenibacillus donghaensis]|uniref:Uncharacterized protein n=1 Tax=Paenibacillus donghaensis TaxID=414771 RepID=A0A2Z2KHZ8_9BACL|nr:hypothetical protein [Paenibacillus donghaensis]ASA21819.1 hypothetical protein B9T62_14175 [Paenibacillus donghaensis]